MKARNSEISTHVALLVGTISRRIAGGAATGVAIAGFFASAALAPAHALAAAPTDVSVQQTLINQDRATQSLPALLWSTCLADIAVQNAQRMAAQGYISHTNGPQLDLACGSGYPRSAGENVAYLSSGIDDATANQMFMNSAPHRANIMGAYQYVATAWAVAPDGAGYIAVEFLGAPSAMIASGLHPMSPARILDTRNGTGAPAGRIAPGGILNVQVTGSGGVPSTGVSAVVLNVTVTNASAGSYLTVYPKEDPQPGVSNLNWVGGQTVANLVEVGLADSGQLSVYNAAGYADVIFDVAGYVPTTTATAGPDGLFTPLPPSRILDTRTGNGASGAVPAGGTITVHVSGRGGVPSVGVAAVVLNVTVTNPTAGSYLTVYPAGSGMPLASNLNYVGGQTVANRVVAKLGAGGQLSFYNAVGSVDVIADVAGWFTDASNPAATGSTFVGVTPVRILDTRNGLGKLGQGASLAVQVAGSGGVPLMTSTAPTPATAVVLNITVTNPSAPSYLTAWPAGLPQPLASDLNFMPGRTVPNLVVVALGTNGQIDLYNAAGATDVIVDVVGWYG